MTGEREEGLEAVAAIAAAAAVFVAPLRGASPGPSDGQAGIEGETLAESDGSAARRQSDGGVRGRPLIGGADGGEGNDSAIVDYCAGQPENDTGNAYRLLARHGANFVNVRKIGLHRWAGTHFEVEDGEEHVTRFAQACAASIEQEADMLGTTEWEAERIHEGKLAAAKERKNRTAEEEAAVELAAALKRAVAARKRGRRKFGIGSGNTQRLTGMVTQALPWRTLGLERMDPERLALNLLNGTMRFTVSTEGGQRRVERGFAPHNRADLFTKVMPATYQPEADCPRWLDFLEMTQPDAAMREFLQCFAGAALLGAHGKPVILFHYGEGANGKSTFAEGLHRLFGGYSQALNAEAFAGVGQKRGDQATPELAQLPGKRLVIVNEIAEGEPVREALLKALSGGNTMQARHLNGRFFDFVPAFRAMMSGNAMPRITGTDFGIWRRLKIVPWEVTLQEPSQRDMEIIMSEFAAERPGILNWLLDGLERYMLEGFSIPPKVQVLTDAYKAEVDIVGSFLEACVVSCAVNPDDAEDGIQAGPLFETFALWAQQNGKPKMTNTRFGREMAKKNIQKIQKAGRYRYVGVRLSPDAPRQEGGMWGAGSRWEPDRDG